MVALGLLPALAALLAPVQASRATAAGMVGSAKCAYTVRRIATTATYRLPPGSLYAAITEVHPGAIQPRPYHYLVSGVGMPTFERVYAARGFGPVTCFVSTNGARSIILHNLVAPADGPCILGVRGVTQPELARVMSTDRFLLMGTVINPVLGDPEGRQVTRLAAGVPINPQRHIARGFSCEIYYAAHSTAAVKAELALARDRARSTGMPALLGFVSWWAGTPMGVPDGQGGKFNDLKYQQVCYTPGAEHAEDPALKALLGGRYNRHYRLSVPNIWSNTPWLTMNSPVLDSYRAARMRDATRMLKEVSGGDLSWVAGVFLENEPRYWDTQSTRGTPQWAGEQWADFNPLTVAAAARDGVALDPADGMSPAELRWLQGNIGRYFQQTMDAMRAAMSAAGLRNAFPLYTHSLQLAELFPCAQLNESPADWARARGAWTGIEGIWSNLSDFDRVREWGPWCNLNRESTDGNPIDTHLWDLRACYAAGALLYNAYNWHALKGDGYFGYLERFMQGLPRCESAAASATPRSSDTLLVTPPQSLQACDTMTAGVKPVAAGIASVAVRVAAADGRSWWSERRGAGPGGPLGFHFPSPAEFWWAGTANVSIHAYDRAGREMPGGAAFEAGEVRMTLDLDRVRAQSRLVIGWNQGGAR